MIRAGILRNGMGFALHLLAAALNMIVGLFVGIDLVIHGSPWVMLALSVRTRRAAPSV